MLWFAGTILLVSGGILAAATLHGLRSVPRTHLDWGVVAMFSLLALSCLGGGVIVLTL